VGYVLCYSTKMNKTGLWFSGNSQPGEELLSFFSVELRTSRLLGRFSTAEPLSQRNSCFLIPFSARHSNTSSGLIHIFSFNSFSNPVYKLVAGMIIKPNSDELYCRHLSCAPGMAMCSELHENSWLTISAVTNHSGHCPVSHSDVALQS
jgi:hypothetical protein